MIELRRRERERESRSRRRSLSVDGGRQLSLLKTKMLIKRQRFPLDLFFSFFFRSSDDFRKIKTLRKAFLRKVRFLEISQVLEQNDLALIYTRVCRNLTRHFCWSFNSVFSASFSHKIMITVRLENAGDRGKKTKEKGKRREAVALRFT